MSLNAKQTAKNTIRKNSDKAIDKAMEIDDNPIVVVHDVQTRQNAKELVGRYQYSSIGSAIRVFTKVGEYLFKKFPEQFNELLSKVKD